MYYLISFLVLFDVITRKTVGDTAHRSNGLRLPNQPLHTKIQRQTEVTWIRCHSLPRSLTIPRPSPLLPPLHGALCLLSPDPGTCPTSTGRPGQARPKVRVDCPVPSLAPAESRAEPSRDGPGWAELRRRDARNSQRSIPTFSSEWSGPGERLDRSTAPGRGGAGPRRGVPAVSAA